MVSWSWLATSIVLNHLMCVTTFLLLNKKTRTRQDQSQSWLQGVFKCTQSMCFSLEILSRPESHCNRAALYYLSTSRASSPPLRGMSPTPDGPSPFNGNLVPCWRLHPIGTSARRCRVTSRLPDYISRRADDSGPEQRSRDRRQEVVCHDDRV